MEVLLLHLQRLNKMDSYFDVYSISKFDLSDEKFARISRLDPVIKSLPKKLICHGNEYLGLKLSVVQVIWICKIFHGLSIQAYPISIEYKIPKITKDDARKIAEFHFSEAKTTRPELRLDSLIERQGSGYSGILQYSFFAASPKLIEEGNVPGGLIISVDKSNGKILTPEGTLDFELMMELIRM